MSETNKVNVMKKIFIEKVTLNIGTGKSSDKLEKALKLLKNLTDATPVQTLTNKRIAAWGLRPGLPIGSKVTIRGKSAVELLNRLLDAKDRKLKEKQFDDEGSVSFGIPEYIDITHAKYDPDIGVIGLQACITLARPGFRVKRRRLKTKIGKNHRIKKQNAIEYIKKEFNVEVSSE